MTKQTSTVVYEFTNEIYPYSVYIGIGVSDLAVRKMFMRYNERDGKCERFKIWENRLRGVGLVVKLFVQLSKDILAILSTSIPIPKWTQN